MGVLVLSGEDVTRLLRMRECIQVMRDALTALARGKALVALRLVMRMPDGSELTLCKSPGLAVEDVAFAAFVAQRARETAAGQQVER